MVVSGRLTPFLLETRPATSTTVSSAAALGRGDPQHHLAVVDEEPVALGERAQDFRMRQIDARLAAGRGVAVEDEGLALAQSTPPPANVPSLSFGPCRSTRMPIGRPVSSSTSRIIATRSRIPSCEAWLMLMRKTSAPAANRAAMVLRSAEAGPRVAMILTRRRRDLQWRSSHDRRRSPPRSFFRLAGTASRRRSSGVRLVGQLHRPALGVLAGVDFEEAGSVEAAHKAILPAVDLELAI